jgi:hypothetical protein
MRVNRIRIQTERKPQDRSVRCAEKRRHQARRRRVRGPIRRAPGVCATTDTVQSEKRLFNSQNQTILTSDGRPLGVCRVMTTCARGRSRRQDDATPGPLGKDWLRTRERTRS